MRKAVEKGGERLKLRHVHPSTGRRMCQNNHRVSETLALLAAVFVSKCTLHRDGAAQHTKRTQGILNRPIALETREAGEYRRCSGNVMSITKISHPSIGHYCRSCSNNEDDYDDDDGSDNNENDCDDDGGDNNEDDYDDGGGDDDEDDCDDNGSDNDDEDDCDDDDNGGAKKVLTMLITIMLRKTMLKEH
ncbi:halomucin [Elysia marginata]|uniref:Halomucin n=1 Tax=Elysia marginata TaxID=1093978 RepID=A0AAV4IR68_9GAST|nr:halomucin [Elysia marginata]